MVRSRMLALTLLLALPAVARVPADDPRVVVIGHAVRARAGVVLSWSLTELRARFSGTSLAIDVEERSAPAPVTSTPAPSVAATPAPRAASTVRAPAVETDRLAVTIDGARTDIALPAGAASVILARGLAPGAHDVSIVKRTEPLVGDVAVRAFVLDDGAALLDAPRARTHRVEIIGDSLATGFGITGNGPDCPFSADTEDATVAFPALLGRRFDADVVAVAWSGRGVYRGFDGKSDRPSVPALWRAAAPTDRAPDAVVVALGVNDFLEGVPDRGAFFAAYHALLDDVRKAYPKAWIVLASPMPLSPKPDDPAATVAPEWIHAILTKRGDGRMSWVQLPPRDDALGLGCVWHAGPKMHERLAGVIGDHVAKWLKW